MMFMHRPPEPPPSPPTPFKPGSNPFWWAAVGVLLGLVFVFTLTMLGL